MATVVYMDSGRVGYRKLVHAVRRFGEMRTPRGLQTRDAGHVIIEILSPYDALPLGVGRKLNTAIAAAEATQLVAGRADHRLLPRITRTFEQFAEPDGRFHGAYGDRIGAQVAHAVRKIENDRDTRQAVITLWDAFRDNVPQRRDYPCTVALNLAVVNDQLELRTLMRSNDVWLGFPYDIFQFTQLQLTVARALGVEPGRYTHETWSLHLYESNAERVDELLDRHQDGVVGPYQPTGFGLPGNDWSACRASAETILEHAPNDFSNMTESEAWYVQQLRPYVADPTNLG